MTRRLTSVAVGAIALLLVQWSEGADLYVRVVDQGEPVAGLTAENFRNRGRRARPHDSDDAAPKDKEAKLSVRAFRLNDDVRHDYEVTAKPVVRFSAR